MTALEKVLLLVSFRKSGKLSKDDKNEILGEEAAIWERQDKGLMFVCS